MPGNLLRGIIKIDEAPGNAKAFDNVAKGVIKTETALARLPKSADNATGSLINLGRVVQDAPFGFIGIANNLNPLFEGFGRLSKQSGGLKGAFKELGKSLGGAGGISLAISVGSALLSTFGDRLFKTSKEADKAADSLEKVRTATAGIFSSAAKEAAEAAGLVGVLKNETETRERKLIALKELQRIQPEIFGQLKLEGDAVKGLDAAYTTYLQNLRTVIAVKIKQALLEQKITELLEKQGQTLTKSEKSLVETAKSIRESLINPTGIRGDVDFGLKDAIEKEAKDAASVEARIKSDIEALLKDITDLSKGVDLKDAVKKGTDPLDELIKKAKELADFFNKTTIRDIQFDIDPTLSKQGNADRAKEFIQKVLDPVSRTLFRVKPQIDVDAEIRFTPDLEFIKRSFETPAVTKTFDQAKSDFEKSINEAAARNPVVLQVAANVKIGEDFEKRLQATIDNIKGIISSGARDLFEGFAEGLGAAIGGQTFGSEIIDLLGNFIQQIGKALISYGIVKTGLDKVIKGGLKIPGAVAIALGAAAIALGALVKSTSKIQARALGGPVSAGQPYLVGEKGPELFMPNTGGRIVPNNRLGSGGIGAVAGGVNVNLTGSFDIAGDKLVLFLNKTNKRQGRLV